MMQNELLASYFLSFVRLLCNVLHATRSSLHDRDFIYDNEPSRVVELLLNTTFSIHNLVKI